MQADDIEKQLQQIEQLDLESQLSSLQNLLTDLEEDLMSE